MKKTPLLRYALVVLLVALAALAPACEHKTNCADCEKGQHAAATTKPVVAASPVTRIEPWVTFNEAFNGCAGGCGIRMTGASDGVVTQPGAMLGQSTYCPVSGVAFEIKATSAKRQVGGKVLFFCCESCAAYFTVNQASILAARGIAA